MRSSGPDLWKIQVLGWAGGYLSPLSSPHCRLLPPVPLNITIGDLGVLHRLQLMAVENYKGTILIGRKVSLNHLGWSACLPWACLSSVKRGHWELSTSSQTPGDIKSMPAGCLPTAPRNKYQFLSLYQSERWGVKPMWSCVLLFFRGVGSLVLEFPSGQSCRPPPHVSPLLVLLGSSTVVWVTTLTRVTFVNFFFKNSFLFEILKC